MTAPKDGVVLLLNRSLSLTQSRCLSVTCVPILLTLFILLWGACVSLPCRNRVLCSHTVLCAWSGHRPWAPMMGCPGPQVAIWLHPGA